MDRRLASHHWNRDRRVPAADQLRAALAARGPMTFSELVDEVGAAEVADVATWLAGAQLSGFVEELAPEGPGTERRFRLHEDAAPPERRSDRVRFLPTARRADRGVRGREPRAGR